MQLLTDGLVDANKVVTGIVLGLVTLATVAYLVRRLLRR